MRKKEQELKFSNKSCVQCFGCVERELHFMLKEIGKNPKSLEVFREELFHNRGAGHHRHLLYREFYVIGMIKLFHNMGFTIPVAIQIFFDGVFTGSSFLKEMFVSKGFFFTARSNFGKNSFENIDVVLDWEQCMEWDRLWGMFVNMECFNAVVSTFVEKILLDKCSD